jgi:uncharacterized hydrophobic protein (TIGR00271 family)
MIETKKIVEFINLNNGEEHKEKVLDHIKSNISFRGSNLWILACAIVIASVGLNVNSTAVIIGAMLISPLMGPIVGAGFALAIYDFSLLKKSGKNLLIATIACLFVATVYFYFSPFKEAQSELLARTSPNIYDVLIAFFGGLVGVIALTRVDKGNPIPGVSIATALMPPLCTAGYGLATEHYQYFLGAFYLYLINCFFICISTFLIVKYLKYEPVKQLNPSYEKRIRYGISVLVLVLILPSSYLAYNLMQQNKYNQKVEQFIANEFTNKGYTIIHKKTVVSSNPKKIELAFLLKKFNDSELKTLNQKLSKYELSNTVLEIKQEKMIAKAGILNELSFRNKVLEERKILNVEILKEINILFPELKNVSLGEHQTNSNSGHSEDVTVLLYQNDEQTKPDIEKIEKWLRLKLHSNNIELVQKP